MGQDQYKGRVFKDGETRFYVPQKHAWLTEQELKHEANAARIIDVMTKVASFALGGGALLWMIIQTFT